MTTLKVKVFVNNREVNKEELNRIKIKNSTVNKIVNEIADLNGKEKLSVA